MKAIVIDQSAPLKLAFGELPEPKPEPNQAIVKVAAVSLNRGEIAHVPSYLPNGASTGWDFAGTVEQPAGDGSGPKAGARVVGASNQKSFAEKLAATAGQVAELPDSVSFEDAATLPVAGLTAYFSLWHGGLLLGRKVLVTGTTGGVGHFAVQLANLSGAHVVASVRRPDQEQIAREAGARDVAIGEDLAGADAFSRYDLVVDGVGGKSLANALTLLKKHGLAVNYGFTGGDEITFSASQLIQAGGGRLYSLFANTEMEREPPSIGLALLSSLVAEGRLKPLIGTVRPWPEFLRASQDLIDRKYSGKVVITLG